MDERPYYAVPLLPRRGGPRVEHHAYRALTGQVKFTVEAVSPVFVGSGDLELDREALYQSFARVGDNLVLPGSSLKGVLRSYVEALSPSCLAERGRCRDADGLCPACGIFGAMGYTGRVSVFDAVTGETCTEALGIEERWSPSLSLAGRKFYHHAAELVPGTERVETVSPGTTFAGNFSFRNLQEWELGLVFLGMGVATGRSFLLKLGGGKAQGLGSVRFELHPVVDRQAGTRPPGYPDACVDRYLQHAERQWKLRQDVETVAGTFSEDSAVLSGGDGLDPDS